MGVSPLSASMADKKIIRWVFKASRQAFSARFCGMTAEDTARVKITALFKGMTGSELGIEKPFRIENSRSVNVCSETGRDMFNESFVKCLTAGFKACGNLDLFKAFGLEKAAARALRAAEGERGGPLLARAFAAGLLTAAAETRREEGQGRAGGEGRLSQKKARLSGLWTGARGHGFEWAGQKSDLRF